MEKWTVETKELLKALWLQGKTSGQIALELSVSRNAVMGQVNRLGLLGQTVHGRKILPIKPQEHTILSLTSCQCHWPLHEREDKTLLFCGEPVERVGKPYCAEHSEKSRSGWQPRYVAAQRAEFEARARGFRKRSDKPQESSSLVPTTGEAARTG